MSNGCGGDGGFDFEIIKTKLKKLPLVDESKLDSLYQTIEAKCCVPHDKKFTDGGNILDYIKANFEFAENLMGILHWTNTYGRMGIFFITFFGLNLFSRKYFNWK